MMSWNGLTCSCWRRGTLWDMTSRPTQLQPMLLALQLSDLVTAWYNTVLCDVTGATTGYSPVSAVTIYMIVAVYNSHLNLYLLTWSIWWAPNNASKGQMGFNPLNAELNPICHLLALLEAHPILHVSRVRVNLVFKGLTYN